MKTNRLIIVLVSSLSLSGYGKTDDFGYSEKYIDKYEHLLSMEAEHQVSADSQTVSVSATGYCVSPPFPSFTSGSVYQGAVTYARKLFNIKVWRIGCTASNSNVLIRIEPRGQSAFICGTSFHIIQNLDQYDAILTKSTDELSSFCDDLLVPKTFLLNQRQYDIQFNDDLAFSIVWGVYVINVGPYDGAPPSGCALGGVSTYTPTTGTLSIPSVQLPSGKCYDVQMQRIAPLDTLNFSLNNAVLK